MENTVIPKIKIGKKFLIIAILLIVLECVAIILTYNIYIKNKNEIISQFNARQYLIAKEVSYRIKDFFENIQSEMSFVAAHPSIIQGDSKNREEVMGFFYERVKDKALSLRRLDSKGIITNLFSETLKKNDIVGKDNSKLIYFQSCKVSGKPFLSNELSNESGEQEIHLSVPLFDKKDNGEKIFTGILSVDLSLDWLIEKFVLKSQLENIGHIIIIDSNGTLLSQIKHPEMVFNNVFSRDEKCFECHSSFEPLEEMIQNGEGVFKCAVKGEGEKYLAAATIPLPGVKWIVAFNISVSNLQAITKNVFRQTGVLIIFIIAAIVIGLFLVFRFEKEDEVLSIIKKNVAEVNEAKAMLEKIIQSSVDGIIIVKNTGMITASNEAAEKIMGYTEDELKEMHTSMLASPDSESLQKRREMLEELFKNGKVKTHETLWKRKNGEIFPVESTNSLIKNADGDYIEGIVIFRDISERKNMEDALVNAQRLAVAGEMGITVKHEINNPLGGIIGYSELILKHEENLTEKDKIRVKEIHKMAIRIRAVVNSIETLKNTKTVDYVDGIKMIKLENNGSSAAPDSKTTKAGNSS